MSTENYKLHTVENKSTVGSRVFDTEDEAKAHARKLNHAELVKDMAEVLRVKNTTEGLAQWLYDNIERVVSIAADKQDQPAPIIAIEDLDWFYTQDDVDDANVKRGDKPTVAQLVAASKVEGWVLVDHCSVPRVAVEVSPKDGNIRSITHTGRRWAKGTIDDRATGYHWRMKPLDHSELSDIDWDGTDREGQTSA